MSVSILPSPNSASQSGSSGPVLLARQTLFSNTNGQTATPNQISNATATFTFPASGRVQFKLLAQFSNFGNGSSYQFTASKVAGDALYGTVLQGVASSGTQGGSIFTEEGSVVITGTAGSSLTVSVAGNSNTSNLGLGNLVAEVYSA